MLLISIFVQKESFNIEFWFWPSSGFWLPGPTCVDVLSTLKKTQRYGDLAFNHNDNSMSQQVSVETVVLALKTLYSSTDKQEKELAGKFLEDFQKDVSLPHHSP